MLDAGGPVLPLKTPARAGETGGRRGMSEMVVVVVGVATIVCITLFVNAHVGDVSHAQHPVRFDDILLQLDQLRARVDVGGMSSAGHVESARGGSEKRLIFYNRPPKTGSTSVRVAMKKAVASRNGTAAHCFNMIEWNEMGLKTIVNRRDVDFYGCHTRLHQERYKEVRNMRGGNVLFMTSTREASKLALSAYLQENRDRGLEGMTDEKEIRKEVGRYKKWVKTFPVDFLYAFHGGKEQLIECPVEWRHVYEMREMAARYELIVDLDKSEESAVMAKAVTGMDVDFGDKYNERSTETDSPLLQALKQVDTEDRSCGNRLVHEVLQQQFNIIKDRLMQNRCFEEADGSWWPCEQVQLTADGIRERGRDESQAEGRRLRRVGLGEADAESDE